MNSSGTSLREGLKMSNYVYGKNSFFEALRNGRIIMAYVLDPEAVKSENIRYKVVDRSTLDRMSGSGNHQGYLAEVKEFEFSSLDDMIREKNGLIVMLDSLQDVHNLGAIIRTSECIGVDGIIYKKDNSVRVNDTVAKISSGALEYVKICEVTNLVNTITKLKEHGYWIVGSDGSADTMYTDISYDMNTVLVIGSEGKGMSRLVKEQCDFIVKLPMLGKVSSLNASVAAGILLYNIYNSRSHS